MNYLKYVVLIVASALLTGCPLPFEMNFQGPLPTAKWLTSFEENGNITVFYPVNQDGTTKGLADLPVIILNTGWNQPRATYEGYGEQYAQWGMVCVLRPVISLGLAGTGAPLFEENVQANFRLMDWLVGQDQDPQSPLYELIDPLNIGETGHSQGAGVAIEVTVRDPRVKACVSIDGNFAGPVFDPRPLLPEVNAAIMYLYSSEGKWCSGPPGANFGIAKPLYDFTAPPTTRISIIGADHIDFFDTPVGLGHLANYFCPRGTADAQDVRDIAHRYGIAWFGVYLKGLSMLEPYYHGAYSDMDEASGIVSIQRRLE